MSNRPDFAIDIDGVLASKGVSLPSFVKKVLKRFLHLDFLNEYFVRGDEGVEFCTGALEYLGVNVEVIGLENVPDDGSLYTFVSNHPLGGIDGVAMGSVVGRNFGGKVRYLVNDLLMNIKGLAPICVPINMTGGQSKDLPKLIDEAFSSDNHMVMFPSGQCSRKTDGIIQDRAWGKAFVNKSIQTGRKVVPVHFIAENSKRFYRIADLCKRLHIKANLAMLLLPDEMYKARGSSFKVVFGEPISPEFFDSSKTPFQWAQYVRSKVYGLNA